MPSECPEADPHHSRSYPGTLTAKAYQDLILNETTTLSPNLPQVSTVALPRRWGTPPLRSPKWLVSPGCISRGLSTPLSFLFLSVSGGHWLGWENTALSHLPHLVLFLHPRPPGPPPRAVAERLGLEHPSLMWVFPGLRLQAFRSVGEHPREETQS